MEDGVGHGRVVRLEGFEDETESWEVGLASRRERGRRRRTFVVRRYEGGEGGDFLERGVLVDSSELEGADEGGEAFGAESAGTFVSLCEGAERGKHT